MCILSKLDFLFISHCFSGNVYNKNISFFQDLVKK